LGKLLDAIQPIQRATVSPKGNSPIGKRLGSGFRSAWKPVIA